MRKFILLPFVAFCIGAFACDAQAPTVNLRSAEIEKLDVARKHLYNTFIEDVGFDLVEASIIDDETTRVHLRIDIVMLIQPDDWADMNEELGIE